MLRLRTRRWMNLAPLLVLACAIPAPIAVPVEAGPNPWTHLEFEDDPDAFSFAIVTDLQGGYRAGVFEAAVERLNLVRPEFVVSVGDLIAGYTEDVAEIHRQWDGFDAMADDIDAPFFYTPGNHDFSNPVMKQVWHERHGRDYYHFVYRDVLFLVLNTEEPPIPTDPESAAFFAKMRELRETNPAALVELISANVDRTMPGIGITDAQVAYFEQVIADNRDARWTFLLMHKPAFQGEGNPQYNRIVAALGERDYTAFAGHIHNYKRFEIGARVHYRLGSTGGEVLPLPMGNMDHFVWITMTEHGPTIANLVLDGILDDRGPTSPGDRLWRAR
jgi:predicted phosphodiesterase